LPWRERWGFLIPGMWRFIATLVPINWHDPWDLDCGDLSPLGTDKSVRSMKLGMPEFIPARRQ